ncbi:BACON domain-containing protein [Bacteroides sp. 51]|uniref:BACON domain-containing protein n=1 Tax=Bacteroides sp. 51 TaxID=2302938 RepID=UPI0013CF679F|nr:BACON domain-containing carbohydrate-binding protein [Bacteroides sp. 51]NDV82364.1 DUF4906 domain-containing protein [Bacteroides sp. 51]
MKRIAYWLLLCLLTATFNSCIADEEEINPGGGTDAQQVAVRFRLETPRQVYPVTRAMSTDAENNVQRVDVLAFKVTGSSPNYTEKFAYHASTTTITDVGTSDKKEFTVKLLKGGTDLYRFVLLTNLDDAVGDALAHLSTNGDKEDILKRTDLLITNTGKWSAEDSRLGTSKPIPMWGETAPMQVTDAVESSGISNIKLIRMLTRLDVEVTTNDAKAKFKLATVHLYNRKTRGYIAPLAANWNSSVNKVTAASVPADSDPTNDPLTILGPLEYNDASTADVAFINEIYTFEAAAAAGQASKATCIVVGGYYDNSPNLSYYRLDFLDNKVYRDLYRNHYYKMNIIKVSGAGYDTSLKAFNSAPINMVAEILEWNQGGAGDVIFDGQYYLSIKPEMVYTFQKDADTDVVRVKTDVPAGFQVIKITEADGSTNTGWLSTDKTIDTYYGTGETETPVNILVTENTTGASRTGYIYIKAGRLEAKLTVTQSITPKRTPIFNFISYTNVNGTGQDVPITGGQIDAKVNTNMGWTLRTDISGVETSMALPASDIAADYTLSVNIPANTLWTSADTKVWIEYKGVAFQEVTYTQPGYEITNATINRTSLLAYAATNVTFSVTGTYPANEVQVRVYDNTNNVELVTPAYITTAQNASTGTAILGVPANPSWNSRTLAFQYYHPGTQAWVDINTIAQAGYSITATATEVMGKAGGTSTVTITGYRPVLYVRAMTGSTVLAASATVAAGTTAPGTRALTIPATTTTRTITIQWSKDNANWTNIVTFTQYNSIAPQFARSNIVWNGSKLTFATTAAENVSIPANSQGVLFQWGSLVAISPAALSGTTAEYTAGRASTGAGHIVYDPTNNYAYAWTSIPYINSTVAPFNNAVVTDDDFKTYNGGQGWDTYGRGDICRYISSQGWVSGKWRLPTQDEYDQLLAELTNGVSNRGGFSNIIVSPAGGTNHYGYYQPSSGRWLGAGATTSSGVASPTVGAYFPAGGYRGSGGIAVYLGHFGCYWSGSSVSARTGFSLSVSSMGAGSDDSSRYGSLCAFPVRCVRE